LRERREDIPLLVRRFIEEVCGPEGLDFQEEAMALLLHYDYPGNVRELRAIVHSAVNLAQGKTITPAALPEHLRKKMAKPAASALSPGIRPLSHMERIHILKVYEETGRNKAQTAQLLEISLNTLRRKLESYGIT
jgi:DNA-binding NtrC family response regulator